MAAYDYVPLYGAGDIIPGTTAGILANLGITNPNVPVYQLLGSQNAGQATNALERMQFAAQPGQSYRLVNNKTGEVLGEASTPEAISALVDKSNALSQSFGKKADLSFEQANPQAIGGGYTQMFQDKPDVVMDTPMKILAAAMAAMTGAGLLQPGGLAGLGAASSSIPAAVPAVAEAGSLAPAALASLPANIAAVNAGAQAALGAAGLGAGAAGAAGGIGGGLLSSSVAPAAVDELAPLIVTAGGSNFASPSVAALTAGAGAASTLSGATPAASTAGPANETTGTGGRGFLGTGMSLSNLATLGSLGASAIGSLLGGSGAGATGSTTPYVSPFGTGAGFGTGMDYRAQPAIADYEKYGFGPEAAFFRPEYNRAFSAAADPAATTTPIYQPLI